LANLEVIRGEKDAKDVPSYAHNKEEESNFIDFCSKVHYVRRNSK
jgi:hypothetical protein